MSITSAGREPDGNTTEAARSAATVHAPVLITEQQVLFSSAASVAVPPTPARRWIKPIRLATTAVRQLFVSRKATPRSATAHYPPRTRSYYDSSLSGRERFRL
jgi:hypothetical protein